MFSGAPPPSRDGVQMTTAGCEGVGLNVVFVGGVAGGVTEDGRGRPNVCGILDGEGGGGTIAEEMGVDRNAERCLRPTDDCLADGVFGERLSR